MVLYALWAWLTQAVGTITLAALPVAVLLWYFLAHKVSDHAFTITRSSEPTNDVPPDEGSVAQFLELDDAWVENPKYSRFNFMSISQYFNSLVVDGHVDTRTILVTAMKERGLSMLLPLATFLPGNWQRDSLAQGPSELKAPEVLSLMLSNVISTLDMSAMAATLQRFLVQKNNAAKAARQKGLPVPDRKPAKTPLDVLLNGDATGDDDVARTYPNPFIIETAIPQLLKAKDVPDTEEQLQGPEVELACSLLPDLYSGSGGVPFTSSAKQKEVNHIMAIVFNRLMANSMPQRFLTRFGKMKVDFIVKLSENDTRTFTTVDDLVAALEETHSVVMRHTSSVTTFGIAFSVKNPDGSFSQVPVAFPLTTGVTYFDQDTRAHKRALTLMSHSSIQLIVKGPTVNFHLEWCISTAGFTGWLSYTCLDRAWQYGEDVIKIHNPEAYDMAEKRGAVLRLLTASSLANNAAAQAQGLSSGGYGFLGVCVDSVAAVQMALTGDTTMFPLTLGGDAKSMLLSIYEEGRKLSEQGIWPYGEEIKKLQAAIYKLQCDIVVEPKNVPDSMRRAIATLPESSIFKILPLLKAKLQQAADSAVQPATSQ